VEYAYLINLALFYFKKIVICSWFSKTISKIVSKLCFQNKIWMIMNIITNNKIKWRVDLGSTQVARCSHYKTPILASL
jgi:hypothetical protein